MASTKEDEILTQQKEAINALLVQGKKAYEHFLEAYNIIDFLNEEEKQYFADLKLEKIIYSEDDNFNFECEEINSDPEVCVSLECDGPVLLKKESSAKQTQVIFSPGICKEIINIIKASSSSIKIAMFMFTDISIFKAICQKKKSNPSIAVHILVDESQYGEFLEMAKKSIKKKFSEQLIGINVKSINKRRNGDRSGKAHEKFMIVDGSIAVTGSFNFTWTSEHVNHEHVIISQDKDSIVMPLLKHFRCLEKKSPYEKL